MSAHSMLSMSSVRLWFALVVTVLGCNPCRAGQSEFVAVHVDHPVAMTGRLDVPVWNKAHPVRTCHEVQPHAHAGCPYPTEVRILYNDHYLYVGIKADGPHPERIRGHFVRRDKLYSPVSDDHLQLYLDALGTGRSARIFAINIRNNQLDGFWNEATQSEDYSANFDWTSATARTSTGWTAVFRIPFTSLAYRPGRRQVWKLIVWRGLVRDTFYAEASAAVPHGTNCLLCHAGHVVFDDFPESTGGHDLTITPEATAIRTSTRGGYGHASDNHLNLGGYIDWRPRIGTEVNAMWNPDFSQVESDDFQPTANNQFALSFAEKRPFFLKSRHLLASPIRAIYTRSITQPRWGVRWTQQTGNGLFTVLGSRDRGGGTQIEPGVLDSTLVAQPGSSLATLGRMQTFVGRWRVGGLFTYRRYQDGSYNFVVGPDVMWTPTDADRIRVQYLRSMTRNPDRPDLFAGWHGQALRSGTAYVDWSHGTGRWAWEATYKRLGNGFRAWEGYVPQVGIQALQTRVGYNFWPGGAWASHVKPELQYTRRIDMTGRLVTSALAPTLVLDGVASSHAELAWHPGDRQLTHAGMQHLQYATFEFSSSPGAYLTLLKASLRTGDGVDYRTGDKGHGSKANVSLQVYPLDRLELDMTVAYQYLDSQAPGTSGGRLFDEHGVQVRTLWYFTRNMYIEASAERDVVTRHPENYTTPVDASEKNARFSLIFAWESSALTHLYAGFHGNHANVVNATPFTGRQDEFFIKFAYAMSP